MQHSIHHVMQVTYVMHVFLFGAACKGEFCYVPDEVCSAELAWIELATE